MAVKRICDICGEDAPERVFCVPIKQRYYATGVGGKKLAMFERVEVADVNLCNKHQALLASIFDMLQEEYMKG